MLSQNAKYLLSNSYCKYGEEPEDVYRRVVNYLFEDDTTKDRMYNLMTSGTLLPNSPCIHNSGNEKSILNACFVLPIDDDIGAIFDTVTNMAKIFHYGGGVGINFSSLREKDSPLKSGGASSGVVSFMNIFDSVTDTVKQGGYRRGALMGCLDYSHPEIFRFINAKLKGRLQNFNISVCVDDLFMNCIKSGKEIPIISPKKGIVDSVKAKDIFDVIAFSAWSNGDPGLLFISTANKENKNFPDTYVSSTNPCLSKDTMIKTTMGDISIEELANTRSKSADVYCMVNGKLAIRRATQIRPTVKNPVELLEIITTRGSLKCTPDHPIYVIGLGWTKAKDLKPHQQLIGLKEARRGVKYKGVSLSTQEKNDDVMEHRFVAEYYYGKINDNMDVHHINENTHDNRISNLQLLPHSLHSSIRMEGNTSYNTDPITGRFSSKENKKEKQIINTGNKCVGWYIISVNKLEEKEIVYNMEVEEAHNFIANGIVVHNCGEQWLPPYGACCLGSINLGKFVRDKVFNYDKFVEVIHNGMKMLDAVNKKSWFPIPEITETVNKLQSTGLGWMGFADALIKMEIYYDSQECLDFIDSIGKVFEEETDNYDEVKRFTRRSIAPTGSLSILANCSSGIEPIFDSVFERHLTVGVIEETRDIYKSPFVRTAHQVSPEWHVRVQAQIQKWIDNAVSKTVNLPHNASVDDVKHVYMLAWELGCKGVTIFRDQSKDTQVLYSTKKQKCSDEECYL